MAYHKNKYLSPIHLKCQNCGYEFDYQGDALDRTCCSRCRASITLKISNPDGWLKRTYEVFGI